MRRTRLPRRGLLLGLCLGAATGCAAGGDGGGSPAPLERVVEAAGAVRPMEGRLTAVRRWAPCAEVEDGPVSLREPRCAGVEETAAGVAEVARLLQEGLEELSPRERRRVRAAVGLIWNEDPGALGNAVLVLEALTAAAPEDAGAWSDLAAARLLRAQRTGSPFELLTALDAADRALAAAPELPEALFNRALVLGKLGLFAAAEEGWSRLLDRELDPRWAAEAEARLGRLRAARASVTAGAGPLRERLLEEAWPAWARAVVGEGDAGRAQARLRELAERYAAATGDRLLLDATEPLGRLAPGVRRRLAESVLALAAAAEALDRLDGGAGTLDLLAAAETGLERAGSPLVHWARLSGVVASIYRQEWREVAPAARSLAAATEAYPVVRGRALWMEGLALAYRGRRGEAIDRYHEAGALFERTGERVFAGAIEFLLGETCQEAGSFSEAWEHRYRALSALALLVRSEPYRAHNVLYDAAEAALDQGLARPALDLAEASLELSRHLDDPAVPAEALLLHGRALDALERADEAASDFERGLESARSLATEGVRARLEADLERALGRTIASSEPERALTLLESAEAFDRRTGHRRNLLGPAMAEAEAHLALGRPAAAIADLDRALEGVEEDRRHLDSPARRIAFLRRARPALDRVVELLLAAGDPDDLAFPLIESLRSLELAGPDGEARADPARLSRRLPPGVLLWSFHSTPRVLVSWAITAGSARRSVTAIPRVELERLRRELADVGELPRAAGRRLLVRAFERLAAGVADELRAAGTVVVAPDPLFEEVPFHALVDPASGRHLIEDHALLVAPGSRFAVGGEAAAADAGRAVVVAAPDLSGSPLAESLPPLGASAELGVEIADLYPEAVLLEGLEATARALASVPGRARVLHVDSHAWVTAAGPALVLAGPEGLLPVGRIGPELLHGARIVVLGGCSTAAGPRDPLEGSLGLARAFLGAGADAVIGMLRPVDDARAARLLLAVHRGLAAGEPAEAAFRSALVAASKEAGPLGPWSGLQLIGRLSAPEEARPPA